MTEMGEEFYSIIKLITGEEIFALVSIEENYEEDKKNSTNDSSIKPAPIETETESTNEEQTEEPAETETDKEEN